MISVPSLVTNTLRGAVLACLPVVTAVVTVAAPAYAQDHAGHDHAQGAHAEAAHEDSGHGGHGDAHVNWFYGMLGESADVEEPDWMYRTPGMPVPLAAQLINSAILLGLLYRFGKGPVQAGLKKRRDAIMLGIDQASKMKAEAAAQLRDREAKLEQIDAEITRLKREMREAAQAERTAILEEARKRRERMERDAKLLIEQELKAAREELFDATVKAAVTSARQLITAKTTAEDDTRLGEEYINGLKQSLAQVGRQGGGAA